MGKRTRVIIADDQRLLREYLADLLQSTAEVELLGQARDGAEAVRLARALHPDVVVLDVRMPLISGLTAARLISGINGIRILALSNYTDAATVTAMMRAGASGFVPKTSMNTEVLPALKAVGGGGEYISPGLICRQRKNSLELKDFKPAP